VEWYKAATYGVGIKFKKGDCMNKLGLAVMSLSLAWPLSVLAADNPDMSFYRKAAEGGIAEVELGKLAQEKSSTQSVKDFGAMMVKDHSAANRKLQTVAYSKAIKLPTSTSVGQMRPRRNCKMRMPGHMRQSSCYIEGAFKENPRDSRGSRCWCELGDALRRGILGGVFTTAEFLT
jgi:Domain of unknown function (DUF4142)